MAEMSLMALLNCAAVLQRYFGKCFFKFALSVALECLRRKLLRPLSETDQITGPHFIKLHFNVNKLPYNVNQYTCSVLGPVITSNPLLA